MKSLIIDDEAPARSRLRRLLTAHAESVEVIGEAANGLEALERITSLQPDLIFLDIEMPGVSGFQVLQSLPETITPPLVVFVTGYDQHALAAFEANAVAYLLKPVETDRLAQVVDRALRICSYAPQREAEKHEVDAFVKEASAALRQTLRQIVGRKRDRFLLLSPQEICFFRAEDGIVKAHTATETYWVNYQLSQLEASLPEETFFRAHRSALVNLGKIKEIRPSFKSSFLLMMTDRAQTEIQVSERQAALLRRRFPGL